MSGVDSYDGPVVESVLETRGLVSFGGSPYDASRQITSPHPDSEGSRSGEVRIFLKEYLLGVKRGDELEMPEVADRTFVIKSVDPRKLPGKYPYRLEALGA